jgi:hypothetical protein
MKRMIAIMALVLMTAACSNPSTPAGYAGYVKQGSWLGSEHFHSVQLGPKSPGVGWLLSVENISVTPYTYTESFGGDTAVLAKDNLKVEFQAHAVFRVKADEASIRSFMEHYSYTPKKDENGNQKEDVVQVAYDNFIKEPFRTFVRDEVQKRDGLQIKNDLISIGDAVEKRVKEYAKSSPFEMDNVVVGNIQYPKSVADAVALKLTKTQDLERQNTEIEIAKKNAQQRLIEAQGIANAMDVIQSKLTNQYLQHEAIEAQKAQVNSQNHTVIYIPVGANGVPVTEAGRATK